VLGNTEHNASPGLAAVIEKSLGGYVGRHTLQLFPPNLNSIFQEFILLNGLKCILDLELIAFQPISWENVMSRQ